MADGNETTGKEIRCDACGCAFIPEVMTETDGDIEFTFYRCDYCGKAYMVSVTDSQLRANIAEYVRLAEQNKLKRLPEPDQLWMQTLKATNVQMARELRTRYLKEDGHGGE